jgi:hypothetical protein
MPLRCRGPTLSNISPEPADRSRTAAFAFGRVKSRADRKPAGGKRGYQFEAAPHCSGGSVEDGEDAIPTDERECLRYEWAEDVEAVVRARRNRVEQRVGNSVGQHG